MTNNEQNSISPLRSNASLVLTDGDIRLLHAYPLISQRKTSIKSLSVALADHRTLSIADRHLGDGHALRWLKMIVLDVLNLCGARDVFTDNQVIFTARRIKNLYYYFSFSELTYFFEAFVSGRYGTLYVGKSINPQNIFDALRRFDDERIEAIQYAESEQETRRRQAEREEIAKGNTGILAWQEYAKEHDIHETIPLEGVLKSLNKNNLNIYNNENRNQINASAELQGNSRTTS